MPLPDTGCALVSGADNPFVHGDIIVQAGHDLAGVQRQENLQWCPDHGGSSPGRVVLFGTGGGVLLVLVGWLARASLVKG